MPQIEISYIKADELAIRMMTAIGEERTGDAVAATALLLGRLMSPTMLNDEQEVAFSQDVLEWAGTYIGALGGRPN